MPRPDPDGNRAAHSSKTERFEIVFGADTLSHRNPRTRRMRVRPSELVSMFGLPGSLTVESRKRDISAMTECAGRERPISQRQPALVKKASGAIDHQLNGSFNHAV